jgi:hypothetical protein
MKKVSLVTMMLMMTFSMTYAAGKVKPDFNHVEKQISNVKQVTVLDEMKTNADCSVTLKGKLDLGPLEAEVSCTTTAATCSEATSKAASCLKTAMNTVRSIKY